MTKIAIQGVHGCFHEQAARLFYGNEIGVCECLSFEDLFVALDQGKASGAGYREYRGRRIITELFFVA